MAAPDTSNLTTSSQVFETYTLPQIRTIHKSLHVQIDEKAARLRTQVGNSYRELLGTADTIVQMRKDMSEVQNVLGRMGGMCGRTIVESKVAGLGKFSGREDIEVELSQTARAKLLEACALAVGRLLKGGKEGKGERLVLAAKVLVLMRLLIASFGDAGTLASELRTSVETAKKNQRTLKGRLLRNVAKILDKVGDDVQQGDILKALCAYSLAESSGAKDVLRHLLNVRAEAMVLEFDIEEHEKLKSTENVIKGLDLYTRTLLDVQALVPSKLTDALANLKKNPLLDDESMQSLEGLRLDVYEKWCGDDIQYFTPFIRHDDLDGKQARTMLSSWAEKGGQTLLLGLRKTLSHLSDFKAIIDLRTHVLQHWIRDGGKARGFDPSEMLDGLRDAINSRLLAVLDTKASKLRLVGSEVAATLETWRGGTIDNHRSLWDEEMLDMDITIGATRIQHEVLSRLHGRDDTVSRAISSYESWYHLIDDVEEIIQQLRRQRWDNDIDEIEDEDTIETRQELLSKEDPQKVDHQLNKTLLQAYQSLEAQLRELWQAHKDDTNSGQIAIYLLRIIRSIRSQLPKPVEFQSFGLVSVPSLQNEAAASVVKSPIEDFASTVLSRERVIGRVLWEGEPALPSQPSPGTFKLLRNLVTSMSDAGLDLWSPTAVSILKKTFGAQLSEVWATKLSGFAEAKIDEEEATSPPEDESGEDEKDEETLEVQTVEPKDESQRRDLLIQWLYDLLLLRTTLRTVEGSNGPLEELAEVVFTKTDLPSEARERMVKASQEYWKRTSLLFGLLA